MTSPSLLFHTIRHLRPTQVVSRAYYGVANRWGSPDVSFRRLREAETGECRWRPRTDFLPPEEQGNSAPAIRAARFRFQHDVRDAGRPIDWTCADAPMLWRYNLHYFDYLWSLEFALGRAIVEDWISRHAFGRGQVGWAPYPTSLRLMNWCGWFFGRHFAATSRDSRLIRGLRASIGVQAAWLSRRLEHHLLGNHLFENAAALAIVGSCFDGPGARLWRDLGLRLLRRELAEQILPDGMHFELSPMYHSRILSVLLWLLNIADEELADGLTGYAVRMLDALAVTCHPDGGIALLNDSALGVYRPLHELADFARRLGVPWQAGRFSADATFALPAAGYYGARTPAGHYIICDAGPVGPDYIPGHAHGDIFSFELSLFGERLVVDSGVHDYQRGQMRDYCRSTAAHNTVEIGGCDQCEFWDAFKVARRGRPHDVVFEETPRGFRLSGWHDGYRRLAGRPTHHRELTWFHEGTLAVRDTVVSRAAVRTVSRVHLHPECRVLEAKESSVVVERGGRGYSVHVDAGNLAIGSSWSCPEFGVRRRNDVLELQGEGARSHLAFALTRIGGNHPPSRTGLTGVAVNMV